MSLHSYSKCWLHIIWGTLNRENIFTNKDVQQKIGSYLLEYSKEKSIYMKNIFINADHVHALIDLPTNLSIEEALHLLKGNSSYWINKEHVIAQKFSWGRGYAALSVSDSAINKVNDYISNQEEHHRKKSFLDEYKTFLEKYGMKYIED